MAAKTPGKGHGKTQTKTPVAAPLHPAPKKALLLLSGGIDSPVAGRLLQQKGWILTGVHFSTQAVVGKEPEEKAKRLADLLSIPLTTIDVSKEFYAISTTCRKELYFVLSKRMMLRLAGKLASQTVATALVTGESVGQVSSQTLSNLHTIDAASPLPVLRPLIGLDKEQIILLAKRFGTYEMSCGPEFCDALGPAHPATRSDLQEAENEEKSAGVDGMADVLWGTTVLKKFPAK